jgi:hypothetical protein
MTRLSIRILAAVTMLAAFSTPARAASIAIPANSSENFDIFWSKVVNGTIFTALGNFQVDVNDTFADFTATITNNTPSAGEKIHSFGFDIDPVLAPGSITTLIAGDYFKTFDLNKNLSGGFKVDVCAWPTQNCSGGAQTNNMPGLGTSDTFSIRLTGNFSQGIVLSTFAIKVQGDPLSYQIEGKQPPTTVPEPATLVLLGLALCLGPIAARKRS